MNQKHAVYDKVVTLQEPLLQVECWNFITGQLFDLPAGTIIRLNHANDATTTNVSVIDEHGKPKAVPLINNGKPQDGYRFIVDNVQLARVTGLNVPKRTADLVGDIIQYESGEMSEEDTLAFFQRLKDDGTLFELQGHYQSEVRRLGVA